MSVIRTLVLAALFAGQAPNLAPAGEARLAVATNFAVLAGELAASFEAATGHAVSLSSGATGKLYAQIAAGAPFDILLSADAATPERLEQQGLAVSGTRFTYATGRLVLWSIDPTLVGRDPKTTLADPRLVHLAIANPELAPYGKAAMDVLDSLGMRDALEARIVTAENIGQAQAMVKSGAASAGFVAAPALAGETAGSRFDVPPDLHAPIRQDAVLLVRGASNDAARAFLAFLASDAARAAIAAAGYGTGR